MLLGDSAFGIEWLGGAKFAMNYVMLTEGTGKGVHEYTNVSALAEMCVHDDAQRVSLERGPGTKFGAIVTGRLFGLGAISIAQRHYKWLAQWHRRDEDAKIFLFGFSRGALVARMLADLICTCGIPSDAYDARRVFQWWMNGGYNEAIGAFRRERRLMPAHVEYLGLWDTVDSAVGIDGARFRKLPAGVECARQAVARDERRKFFAYEPLEGERAEELVFPGSHSDVGGLYPDNHAMADVTLAWIAAPAVERGLRLKSGVTLRDEVSPEEVLLHDSQSDATNVWGLLPSPQRALSHLRRHPLCEAVKAPFKV